MSDMSEAQFLMLVETTSIALLDAPDTDERQRIATQIGDDSILATAVLMVLSESILPLLPDPSATPHQGLVQ